MPQNKNRFLKFPKHKFFYSKYLMIIAVIFSFAFLAFAVNYTQRQAIASRAYASISEKMMYLPSGKLIKPLAIGMDAALADILWARTVVYFGGHYVSDKDYKWLYHNLDIITTLDPKFVLAYKFGGMMLSLEADQVHRSIALLEKGIKNNPDSWQLYFVMGFNHFYFMDDAASAAKYFEKAAQLPGHPAYVPRLVARMHAKSGKLDVAMAFLEEIEKEYDDATIKSAIAGRYKELIIEKHKIFLNGMVKKYEEKYGRKLLSIEQLLQAGLLKSLPKEPLGGQYIIDAETNKVKSTKENENWP